MSTTTTTTRRLSSALPAALHELNQGPAAVRKRPLGPTTTTTTTTRNISYVPCLPTQPDPTRMFITYNKSGRFASAAVSFKPAGLLHTQLEPDDATIVVRLTQLDAEHPVLWRDAVRPLWNALWCYVARGHAAPDTFEIELPLPSPPLHQALLALGAVELHPSYRLSRSALYQLYHYATTSTLSPPFPYVPAAALSDTPHLVHPLRPPKPHGTVYSRRVPHLDDAFFKLAVCRPTDIGTLHAWLNNARVDAAWKSQGTWEDHEAFLDVRARDPHTLPLIGSFVAGYRNEAFPPEEDAVYAEVYWAKEDLLGQVLGEGQVRDYDRGIQALVGSNSHRGPHRVRAWLPSLVHYCFLDDPRTERVLAEPSIENQTMIEYFRSVGFEQRGTLEFPAKTAAYMVCEKAAFYAACPF